MQFLFLWKKCVKEQRQSAHLLAYREGNRLVSFRKAVKMWLQTSSDYKLF